MTGRTAVYGVIGDPVSHSFSPQIHAYFAELCGLDMAYVPFHVKGKNVGDAIRGAHALGIQGLNVTVPHKMAVMPYLSHIDAAAKQVGTVNTLLWKEDGYHGYNTDYIGILRSISALGMSFKGRSVAVFGAGGSAYAACIAAASGGAERIGIVNRTSENALALASHVNSHYNVDVREVTSPDIVIQTTTVGFGEMKDSSPVSSPGYFAGVQLAFDIIYTPWETVFMRQAREAGVPHVINGFPMLVEQAAAAFGIWHTDERLYAENFDEKIETLAKRFNAD